MEKSVIDLLIKPIKVYQIKKSGGVNYPYVKGSDVIRRLNEAFNYDWSSEILHTEAVHGQIIVHIKLTAFGASKEGFGGSPIQVYSQGERKGTPVDISSAYKSAVVSAIKKTAEQFGIALENDSEDTDAAVGNGPYKSNTNSGPYTPPVKPVSSSITMTASKPVQERLKEELVDKAQQAPTNAIRKVIENALVNGFSGEKSQTLAQAFKRSESASEERISDVQIGAIKSLIKARKLEELDVLRDVLADGSKDSLDKLTRSEATKITTYLNNLKRGGK